MSDFRSARTPSVSPEMRAIHRKITAKRDEILVGRERLEQLSAQGPSFNTMSARTATLITNQQEALLQLWKEMVDLLAEREVQSWEESRADREPSRY